jgi:hypothetical protein
VAVCCAERVVQRSSALLVLESPRMSLTRVFSLMWRQLDLFVPEKPDMVAIGVKFRELLTTYEAKQKIPPERPRLLTQSSKRRGGKLSHDAPTKEQIEPLRGDERGRNREAIRRRDLRRHQRSVSAMAGVPWQHQANPRVHGVTAPPPTLSPNQRSVAL